MVSFDEAGRAAIIAADRYASTNDVDVVVVRDLFGRNSVAIIGDDIPDTTDLTEELRVACTPFVANSPIIVLKEMFNPDLITDSPSRRPTHWDLSSSGRVTVIERGTVGAEWLNTTTPAAPRVTLYGFKGGVGRSSATFALARHLASQGRVVLVVDLDLESPGIGTMLAPAAEDLPEHGLVDHLVEFPVGNAERLELVARSRSVGQTGVGEVWFSAAAGRPAAGYDYLNKLNRVYFDLPANRVTGQAAIPFGARLEEAIAACEDQVAMSSRPVDVVLLDSRSGIHDIAAVAITQLSTLSLLFATDNPQTWEGYRQMFDQWATHLPKNERSLLRNRLQMVAALVPPQDSDGYLAGFADRSQACFASTLYDEAPTSLTEDTFSFAPSDKDAPHYPIPINHSADLIGLVPGVHTNWEETAVLTRAYAKFLVRATDLIDRTAEGDGDA